MTSDPWARRGAPIRLLDTVRGAFEAFSKKLTDYDLSLDSYLLDARDVFDLPAVRERYEAFRREMGSGAVESTKRKRRPAPLPKWSTLVSTWKLLLQKWGRRGWVIFWPKISKIAQALGVNRRQAWERLYWLEEFNLLQVWRRWRTEPTEERPEEIHDAEAEEARSNIYGAFLPDTLLEALRDHHKRTGQRRRTSVPETPPATSQTPPESAPPRRRQTPPPQVGSSSTLAPKWLLPLFAEVRARDARYAGEGGNQAGVLKDPELLAALAQLEALVEEETPRASKRAEAERSARPADSPRPSIPEAEVIAREIAAIAIGRWLDAADSYEQDARCPIGLFAKAVHAKGPKPIAQEARRAWVGAWVQAATEAAEDAEQRTRPRTVHPRVPHDVARAAPSALTSAGAPPRPARPVYPPLGLSSPERLKEFAAIAEQEERSRQQAPHGAPPRDLAPLVPELPAESRPPPE